jgi:hypothetical protein
MLKSHAELLTTLPVPEIADTSAEQILPPDLMNVSSS